MSEFDLAARVGVTLDGLIDAAAKSERWDLATFIVEAARHVLPPGVPPSSSPSARAPGEVGRFASCSHRGSTARRRPLSGAAAGLSRRYEDWALIRFVDDGYDVAQASLSSWSPFGREGFSRGAAVVSELTSLDAFTSS